MKIKLTQAEFNRVASLLTERQVARVEMVGK